MSTPTSIPDDATPIEITADYQPSRLETFVFDFWILAFMTVAAMGFLLYLLGVIFR